MKGYLIFYINLNKRIAYRELDYSKNSTGSERPILLIGFKPNIKFKIGDLPYITNQIFSVPEQYSEEIIKDDAPKLLGLDVMVKHTIIYSQFDGDKGILILPLMNIKGKNEKYGYESIKDKICKLGEFVNKKLGYHSEEDLIKQQEKYSREELCISNKTNSNSSSNCDVILTYEDEEYNKYDEEYETNSNEDYIIKTKNKNIYKSK